MRLFKDLGIKSIAIELNNNCNFRCRYCPVSVRKAEHTTGVLDLEYVKKILDEIEEDGTLEYVGLNLYGEPLLYPHLKEVLEYARNGNIRTRFGTNGYLLSEQMIRTLIDFPPDEIVISVQNFKKDSLNAIKGVTVDYDEWLNRIADYLGSHIRAGCDTRVQISIATNPYNNFICKVLGLGYIDNGIISPYNKSFRKDLDVFIDDFITNRLKMKAPLKTAPTHKNKKICMYDEYCRINDNISFDVKQFTDWYNFEAYRDNHIIDCVTNHVVIGAHKSLLLCCFDSTGQTSIGRIYGGDIRSTVERGYDLFANKGNSKSRIQICRRCKGAPTRRGVFLRGAYNLVRKVARDAITALSK